MLHCKKLRLSGIAIAVSLILCLISVPGLDAKAQYATKGDISEKNYLLYGYNALYGGYINTTNTGTRPILNQSLTQINNVDSTSYSNTGYIYSSSIRKLYEQFSGAFSGSYSGIAFSGKVKTEFSTTKDINENRTYMRYSAYFYDKDISNNIALSDLPNYLSSNFIQDVEALYNKNKNKGKDDNNNYLAEIFSTYGTHLILQYYTGGRLDVNYSYTNTDAKSESEIKASVEATYAKISATATADDKKKAQLVESHASLTSESCGGQTNYQVSGTTVESIAQQFTVWKNHIDEKPDICGVKNGALLGIWELFPQGSNINTALYNEYKRELAAKEAGLDNLDGGPITDITVLVGNTKEAAIAKLPKDYYIALSLDPGNDCRYLDANHHGGGQYIYIAYTYQPVMNVDHKTLYPIIDFCVKKGKSTTLNGYTKIPIDLNKSQGKGTPDIFLFFRRASSTQYDKEDTLYISRICGYYGKDYVLPANWFAPTDSLQLNEGVKAKEGGDDYVNLAFQNTYRDISGNLSIGNNVKPVVAASELLTAEPDDKDDNSDSNPPTETDKCIIYIYFFICFVFAATVFLSNRKMNFGKK